MKFKDDLNDNLRDTPEFYVELRSVLNKLVEARVVDNIEEDIPQGKMPKVDAKTQQMFKLLSREILSGLYLKDTEATSWYPKFGTFKKGSLTNREFHSASESLDSLLVFENKEAITQKYYDFMVAR